jgi:uncharacterized repeat protein (TIGR02543 family)
LPANTEAFVFNGSGTSGSPITLYFQSGAVLASPEWPADGSGGAIDLGSNSYVTVNGNGGANGMTEGVIEATSNGDSGAKCLSGSCTSHGDSNGVEANDGAKNVTIEGLTISDMYVTAPGVPNGGGATCIYEHGNVSNWTITGNTMHDMGWCISLQYDSGVTSNLTISNNQIYNIDHGIALGGPSAGATLTNVNIYGNNIHDFSNWDTSADIWHHDGIHIWGYNDDGSDAISNVNIYDNKFGGSVGQNVTADIFIERNGGNTKNVSIYNNTLIDTGNGADNDGLLTTGQDGGYKIYNNTIDCTSPGNQDVGIGTSNSPSVTIINNIVSGCQLGLMYLNGGSVVSGGIHNNLYAAGVGNCSQGGNDCFDYGSSGWYGLFSTWQSQTGDANSTYATSANLSSLGVPQSGSGAIGTGANLTSLGIATLDSDINGTARPASGAWDMGAYEVSSGSNGGGITPPTVTAPSITSVLSVSATAGSAFSYQITGSNSPTSYSASGLPAGLSVNGVGLISGTPPTAGTYSVSISASNSGGTGSATLTIIVASAAVTKYTLTVAKAGTGSGTVSGGSISCGSTCSESVNSGTAVSLSASAASGSTFTGWSGSCSGTGTCSVTVSATTNVTATFTTNVVTPPVTTPAITSGLTSQATVGSPYTYQIIATNNPTTYAAIGLPSGLSINTQTGIITGSPTTAATNNITLNADNSAGIGTATLNLSITAPVAPVNFTLTASTAGTGTGTMTVAGQNCGSSCTATVAGTSSGPVSVTVTATPAAGSTFTGWSGACTSTSATCTFSISANSSVTANFTSSGGVLPPTPAGSCSTIGSGWTALPVTAQTGGTFTASFDATPGANDIDAVTGLSTNAASQFTDMAAIVRFNPSGDIDAINGPAYEAASVLTYQGGTTYHIVMTVNLNAKTYSATVTSPGHATTTVALNYPFRDTQANASSLAYVDAHDDAGSHTLCNVNVAGASSGSNPPTTPTAPSLSSLSPSSGVAGTQVTIAGTGFGVTSTVFMNSYSAASNVVSSPTSVTFTIPSSLAPACSAGICPESILVVAGTYQVTVQSNGMTSNALTLTASPPPILGCTGTCAPVITSLNPSSGSIGTEVTIAGSGFGSSAQVLMNGLVAESNAFIGNGSILFAIPSSLAPNCVAGQACPEFMEVVQPGTYQVAVLTNNGTSNSLNFTVGTSTTVGVCEYAAPPTGCSWQGGSAYPTCGATLTCSTPPTPVLSCDPVPQGCSYVGGTATSCGTLVCTGPTPPASSTPPTSGGGNHHINRYLRKGSQGSDVTWLQQWLSQNGYYPQGLVTGYYGSLTQAAVQNYQAKNGVVSSGDPDSTGYGNVGPKTEADINAQAGD